MKLNKNETIVLKKYLDSIIICICSFISEDEMKLYLEKSQTIPELLEHISYSLKTRELDGWEGDDLKEEQLNVLTIISELYLKRNKSKYKTIEKPSEIIIWYIYLIESALTKNELKLNKQNFIYANFS